MWREGHGPNLLFGALYTDRGWYYFLTRKGESKVDKKELTQSVRSAIPLASGASSIWAAATGPLLTP